MYLYANLSDNQRDEIINKFDALRHLATDPLHAVAIVAHDVLCPNVKAWNGKKGSESFAATLAVLAMKNKLALSFV